MPEEPRKAAPLPPGPWQQEHGTDNWIRIFDSERLLVGRVPKDLPAVASLFLRAPAVEAAARDMFNAEAALDVARCNLGLATVEHYDGEIRKMNEAERTLGEARERLRLVLGETK